MHCFVERLVLFTYFFMHRTYRIDSWCLTPTDYCPKTKYLGQLWKQSECELLTLSKSQLVCNCASTFKLKEMQNCGLMMFFPLILLCTLYSYSSLLKLFTMFACRMPFTVNPKSQCILPVDCFVRQK